MHNSNKLNNMHTHNETTGACMTETACDVMNEGKKYAKELYQQGVDTMYDAEKTVKEYSDKMVQRIHDKPITAVLVAAGIGMLVSALLRK
ncbi:MAG: hypothetical protein PSV35_08990 [bacterium]|nr:hypothetical protein [bacterium]